MGYEYDCDLATCYCLYNEGTLSAQYSKCFDSMNRSGQGYLSNGEGVSTVTDTDRTCYSLSTQPVPRTNPTRKVSMLRIFSFFSSLPSLYHLQLVNVLNQSTANSQGEHLSAVIFHFRMHDIQELIICICFHVHVSSQLASQLASQLVR